MGFQSYSFQSYVRYYTMLDQPEKLIMLIKFEENVICSKKNFNYLNEENVAQVVVKGGASRAKSCATYIGKSLTHLISRDIFLNTYEMDI